MGICARASAEEQATEGASTPAQLKLLREYSVKHDQVLAHEFVDEGVSARASASPQFQRMIALAKQKPRPFDCILIHTTDRFARNREDAIIYKLMLRRDCGLEIISITEQFDDSPTGRLLEGIREVMAEPPASAGEGRPVPSSPKKPRSGGLGATTHYPQIFVAGSSLKIANPPGGQ